MSYTSVVLRARGCRLGSLMCARGRGASGTNARVPIGIRSGPLNPRIRAALQPSLVHPCQQRPNVIADAVRASPQTGRAAVAVEEGDGLARVELVARALALTVVDDGVRAGELLRQLGW